MKCLGLFFYLHTIYLYIFQKIFANFSIFTIKIHKRVEVEENTCRKRQNHSLKKCGVQYYFFFTQKTQNYLPIFRGEGGEEFWREINIC